MPTKIAGMLILTAATGLAGANDPSWIHGCFAENSPRPVVVAEIQAWQQASALADSTPDAFVLAGTGRSMDPLYSPGAILVLQRVAFAELRRGQTVVYRNGQRKVVAHLLVAKVRDGWRAQGLNNAIHDMEAVNADNFVGVVIAAFQPSTPAPTITLASLR